MPIIPNQEWFEMRDVRKRSLSTAVWIPLAASQVLMRHGKSREVCYQDEFFTCDSLAIPLTRQSEAVKLTWDDVDTHSHAPEAKKEHYTPVDSHEDYDGEAFGVRLAIRQSFDNQEDADEWHLHQDLVVALRLKRENDSWVCPQEAYQEVARLKRKDDGEPHLLEIKAEYLLDYLCARRMGLFVGSFHYREAILASKAGIIWPSNPNEEKTASQRWEGHVGELNADGAIGGSVLFIHSGRNDVDMEEDVPKFSFPSDGEVTTKSWTREADDDGRKIFMVEGRLWRGEWLTPASNSPRVRRDKLPGSAHFVTEAVGTRETKETLTRGSRWLWFDPKIMSILAHRRGGSLVWHTRETGSIGGVPGQRLHFGVNQVGLINIYAKDIGLLPDWEQQFWAGFNVSPNGKVSQELMMSQMQAIPADTSAPEALLKPGLTLLNELTEQKLGFPLIRPHADYDMILAKVHRFRVLDKAGLFELAKDVARLLADSIDAASIQKHLVLQKGEKPGSLKSLEKLLATKIDPSRARSIMTSLAGIYDLRLADAHLASSKTDDALKLVNIDENLPPVWQGEQLLAACVDSIYQIANVLRDEFTTTSIISS